MTARVGPCTWFRGPTGRVAIRWDTRLTWFREVPRPDVDLDEARRELCRRHVRVRIEASVTDAVRSRIEAEALSLPIPNATPSVDFT